MAVQVYFIGAGPGDTELLTRKAKKRIEQADVIVYADSLINPEICKFAGADAQIHKSASLTLEETTDIIAWIRTGNAGLEYTKQAHLPRVIFMR